MHTRFTILCVLIESTGEYPRYPLPLAWLCRWFIRVLWVLRVRRYRWMEDGLGFVADAVCL